MSNMVCDLLLLFNMGNMILLFHKKVQYIGLGILCCVTLYMTTFISLMYVHQALFISFLLFLYQNITLLKHMRDEDPGAEKYS